MIIKPKIKFKINNSSSDYQKSIDFMENYAAQIANNQKPELIWLTSHQPIYTAGISAKDEDLLNKNIPVFKTNRGGKYTYHDEGMRIIYVMLNLKNCFYPQLPDIAKFVEMLENWVIAVLSKIGIKGEIKKQRVGIWVMDKNGEEKKIAAIGIKIRKWISYHGIAINVNPDLKGFEGIVPCGLKEFKTTSIADLGLKINKKHLDKIIKEEFFLVFKNYTNFHL